MNYWLTTHWPPLQGESEHGPTGVYLPNGRERAGKDLNPGDRVLIYQSLTGPTVLRYTLDGVQSTIKSQIGRQGIVVIAEVTSELCSDDDSEQTNYKGRAPIWWRWRASTKTLSANGFVPMKTVNRILGYKKNHNFHGFGNYKSGLKKLEPEEYFALVDAFKRKQQSLPTIRKLLRVHSQSKRTRKKAGESREHRLLKNYIATAPDKVLGEDGLRTLDVEFPFPTGDRADLVLEDEFGRVIGLEVEVSAEDNQIEGVLQAIKYRFMLALMKERYYQDTRSFLVAYSLSPQIKRICRDYDVEFFIVDISDVKRWLEKTGGGGE